jgi:phenylacetate-coenzyme A ligase PaaK-like adenylate-forming protein
MMRIVEGRKDEAVILPDGRTMSSFAFTAAMYQLSFYKDIERFRIVQKKLNRFDFFIKLRSSKVNENSLERELIEVFSRAFKVSESELQFELELVNEIPLDRSGKFRIVVSELETR